MSYVQSGHLFRSMCLAIAGVVNQSVTKSYISYSVLQQRATSYTWTHMNISPSLPPHAHSHTLLLS